MAWNIVGTAEPERWSALLARLGAFDVYHLAGYHRAYEGGQEAAALAFVAEIGGEILFNPVMLRPIRRVGTRDVAPGVPAGWRDAETVYGYGGPLATSTDPAFLAEAWAAYGAWCRDQGIVCEFTRYNPLLGNHVLAAAEARVWRDRETVVIPLDGGEEALWQGYAGAHRTSIRKALKSGVVCRERPPAEALPAFRALYEATMRGLGAGDFYLFPKAYYARLREGLGEGLRLFMASHEGREIAGAMFLVQGETLHYHLAGSDHAWRHLAAANLLIHEAALWGRRRGLRQFHLGGGRTPAPDDSLFGFKARFSPERRDLYLGARVFDREAYDRLCGLWRDQAGAGAGVGAGAEGEGEGGPEPRHFQLYRLDPGQAARRAAAGAA
ncbi:MAG: GNAT family N-acetyltransferase [Rhodospirillales bacterium]|nr:GNAT family N-acetyltransferase [Rhodospirillales bacterium]